jgi:hypothetical protein
MASGVACGWKDGCRAAYVLTSDFDNVLFVPGLAEMIPQAVAA